MRKRYAQWRARAASDGLDEVDAAIVTLAADGPWMADLLGLAGPKGTQRRRIIERLLDLAGSSSARVL
jgi:hypothetical protein